jgi:hypothetical protein
MLLLEYRWSTAGVQLELVDRFLKKCLNLKISGEKGLQRRQRMAIKKVGRV